MYEGRGRQDIPERILSFVVNSENFRFIKELNNENYETWLVNEKSTGKTCLAKKYMIDENDDLEVHKYYQEVITISEIDNPFVANFVGFTVKPPFFIFTEYLKNSSLYEALHIYKKSYPFTGTHLSIIAMGIASGMEKIHEAKVIEPHLCSSNIFLTSEFLPKICHFNTLRTPIKWKAPELVYKVSKDKYRIGNDDQSQNDLYMADVFAYGLILHELLTRKDSFFSKTPERAIELVCLENQRPTIPDNTPLMLKKLIKSCWSQIPDKRPTFAEIYDYFETGEVYFPRTDAKAVEALAKRIRKYEKSSGNKDIFDNYRLVSKHSHSRNRSPLSARSPSPKKVLTLSHKHKPKAMTPTTDNSHHHHHHRRSNSRTDYHNHNDFLPNSDLTALSENAPRKKRSHSASRNQVHYFNNQSFLDSSDESDFTLNRSSENNSPSTSFDRLKLNASHSPKKKSPETKYKKRDVEIESPKVKENKKPKEKNKPKEQPAQEKNQDLQVFQNYNRPQFFSSLEDLPDTIKPNQYSQFFKIISKHFSSDCSSKIILKICDTIQKLFADQEAIKAFINLNIHLLLPIDDQELIDSTFEILYVLFDYNPKVFQSDFSQKMSLLIMKNPEKSLTLLSIFAKSFNKMDDPWPLLDLLFDYENLYFRSDFGSDYISLLFFLNFNFSSFHHERIGRTRPILVHFLTSNDKRTVLTTYRAVCALFDDMFKVPMEIMAQDIIDSDLSFQAISVMLRMNDSSLIPKRFSPQNKPFRKMISLNEFIYPLLKIAESHYEATLLLLKFLKSIEAAKILLTNTNWLTKKLPTIQDTLKIFLSLMLHASLRENIASIDSLAEFFSSLIKSKDIACMITLKSIITRLNLKKNIFPNLIEHKFFSYLVNSFSVYNDERVTLSILNIICYLATKADSVEYLKFADFLKDFIWGKDDIIAHTAFSCLYALSFFTQCACKFKQMKLAKDVSEIFISENDQEQVRIFVENVEKAEVFD